jgi:hypothetical protein
MASRSELGVSPLIIPTRFRAGVALSRSMRPPAGVSLVSTVRRASINNTTSQYRSIPAAAVSGSGLETGVVWRGKWQGALVRLVEHARDMGQGPDGLALEYSWAEHI